MQNFLPNLQYNSFSKKKITLQVEKITMEFDNKTIVIIGIIAIGLAALFTGNDDLALAIGSGLVGYLSKDASIILKNAFSEDEENDI